MSATPIVRVALDVPLFQLFDFLAPDARGDDVGRLVIVPFGPHGRLMVGLVVEVNKTSTVPPEKLKPIVLVQRSVPPFGAADLALLKFCERYYHHPLGEIALNAVPPRLRTAKPFKPTVPLGVSITDAGRAALATMPGRAKLQRELLQSLVDAPQLASLITAQFKGGAALLKRVVAKGWIALAEHAPTVAPLQFRAPHPLNAEQAHAVTSISEALNRFAPMLLDGITGSGKTEVYLHAIHAALAQHKQALVLVPEINLSPAFVRAVATRFPSSVIAQLHSGMADGARTEAWLAAQRGTADIVIGTRLAVFTPMPRLGLIVVDEEHDMSYKQHEGLRYSARDVAVFRAQQVACPVVLGSATPSLETLQNAARARFGHIRMTTRAVTNAALPRVEFIDTNNERPKDGLSNALIRAIDETVARGEQALVFINRRGYAPALVCAACGWMPSCERCTARLVFHREAARLRCHHCGFQCRVPQQCADCGNHQMIAAGEGTERIETALAAALPKVRMARVDRDSTRRVGSAEKIFALAAKGELDVLVGTQMLSKGHDFPKLNLVGVVNADGALFSADFRAAERLAAQLLQVAGRAGRADGSGRVLIQTRFPAHAVYQAVAAQDYASYAAIASEERRLNRFPPFSFLALMRAESKKKDVLEKFLAAANVSAHEEAAAIGAAGIHVWDAVPSTLTRKAGFERQQLLVQAESRKLLQELLTRWLPRVRAQKTHAVRWVIDVDPQEV